MNINNILVIGDETDNSNISYRKASVESSFNYKPGFDKLPAVFNDNPELIYSLNTIDCLLIVDKLGNESSMHEYFRNMSISDKLTALTDNIDFLKITNNILKDADAEIYIKAGLFHDADIPKTISWTKTNVQYISELPDYKNMPLDERHLKASEYIDGYKLCQEILDNYETGKIPNIRNYFDYANHDGFRKPEALALCDLLEFENNGNIYKGYLPSLYQMCCIVKYMKIIDYICGNSLPINVSNEGGFFWTSCEYDCEIAFNAIYYPEYGKVWKPGGMNKNNMLYALPIFKKI